MNLRILYFLLASCILAGCNGENIGEPTIQIDTKVLRCDDSLPIKLNFPVSSKNEDLLASDLLETIQVFVRGGDLKSVSFEDSKFYMQIKEGGLEKYSVERDHNRNAMVTLNLNLNCTGNKIEFSCMGFESIKKGKYPFYWIAIEYILKNPSIFDALESTTEIVVVRLEN